MELIKFENDKKRYKPLLNMISKESSYTRQCQKKVFCVNGRLVKPPCFEPTFLFIISPHKVALIHLEYSVTQKICYFSKAQMNLLVSSVWLQISILVKNIRCKDDKHLSAKSPGPIWFNQFQIKSQIPKITYTCVENFTTVLQLADNAPDILNHDIMALRMKGKLKIKIRAIEKVVVQRHSLYHY